MTNLEKVLRTDEWVRNDVIKYIVNRYCFNDDGKDISLNCLECKYKNDVECDERIEEWLQKEVEEC